MTLAIKHSFVTAKTDGTDTSLLRPSNWNDTHAITLASNNLVGRASAGAGPAEEIPVSAATIALLAAADIPSILAYLGISPPTTGDGKPTLKTVADPGWLLMDDGTFGDALSGASNRINADTQALFTLIYNNVLDASAPLLTSAGAATTRAAQGTAAAAFAAHCRMTLPKQLGRAIVGAGTGAGLTARPLGSNFGGDTATLGVPNLPPYTPVGGVTTTINDGGTTQSNAGGPLVNQGTGSNVCQINSVHLTATSTFTGTPQGGTSTPFAIAQASAAWNVMVKL